MNLNQRLEILLAISLLLSFFSWGKKILFPFQIFTTWVHECCHALTAAILGGSSIKITMEPDGSGLTHYKIPSGRLRQAIVASAGYLGASATGCALFYLAVMTERAPQILNTHLLVIFLCALIAATLLFWIRNGFGFLSTAILGGTLASLNYAKIHPYAQSVLLFLAIQTALNALFDIRTLFGLGKQRTTSDAHTLQKLFYLPHWFWSLLWLAMSAFMMYSTVCYLL